MTRFLLIQRGIFTTDKSTNNLAIDKSVDFQYMGSAEYEWDALPNAYRRIMYNFEKYELFKTGIFSPHGEELMVFCNKEQSTEILDMIKEFIAHPYHLKEYSELEKIPTANKWDTSWDGRRTNFWWCIDRKPHGNWMACMSSEAQKLTDILNHDYECWWLKKSTQEREKEYKASHNW